MSTSEFSLHLLLVNVFSFCSRRRYMFIVLASSLLLLVIIYNKSRDSAALHAASTTQRPVYKLAINTDVGVVVSLDNSSSRYKPNFEDGSTGADGLDNREEYNAIETMRDRAETVMTRCRKL